MKYINLRCSFAAVLTAFFMLMSLTSTAQASFNAKVIAVLDGDTLVVQRGTEIRQVRFLEIDAPEPGQEYYQESQRYLETVILGKEVNVSVTLFDEDKVPLCHIINMEAQTPDEANINETSVKAGMAWCANIPRFVEKSLKDSEAEARSTKRGLWGKSNPIPPWEFAEKNKRPKGVSKYPGPTVAYIGKSSDERAQEAQALRKKGEALMGTSNVNEAITAYQASLKGNGSGADTYAGLGAALAAKERFDEAVAAYRSALGMNENQNWRDGRQQDGDIHLQFALLLARLGRYDEAIQMYQAGIALLRIDGKKALEQRFNIARFDKDSFYALANVGWKAGNYQAQISDETQAAMYRALVGSPADEAAYGFYLGNLFASSGQREKAREQWRNVVALGAGKFSRKAQAALDK